MFGLNATKPGTLVPKVQSDGRNKLRCNATPDYDNDNQAYHNAGMMLLKHSVTQVLRSIMDCISRVKGGENIIHKEEIIGWVLAGLVAELAPIIPIDCKQYLAYASARRPSTSARGARSWNCNQAVCL